MTFGTDTCSSQRMNPHDFDDPLTFYLMLPAGWSFYLSSYQSHTIGWIAMKFGPDIHVAHMMNLNVI